MTPKTSPIAKTLAITKALMHEPHTFAQLHAKVGGDVSSIRNVTRHMVEAGMVRRYKPGPFKPSLFYWTWK